MAKLTPLDIESKTFTKGFNGYNPREVKSFMREVLMNYETLYKENIELSDKINLLNEGIQYYKTIEETLQNTLILAEKTAEETKAVARKRAEQIEKEAEIKAQAVFNEAQAEVYKISKQREALIAQYDASKIQIRHFLKAQIEMTEANEVDLYSSIGRVSGPDYNRISNEEAETPEEAKEPEMTAEANAPASEDSEAMVETERF